MNFEAVELNRIQLQGLLQAKGSAIDDNGVPSYVSTSYAKPNQSVLHSCNLKWRQIYDLVTKSYFTVDSLQQLVLPTY
jgi:hypothetical protein